MTDARVTMTTVRDVRRRRDAEERGGWFETKRPPLPTRFVQTKHKTTVCDPFKRSWGSAPSGAVRAEPRGRSKTKPEVVAFERLERGPAHPRRRARDAARKDSRHARTVEVRRLARVAAAPASAPPRVARLRGSR